MLREIAFCRDGNGASVGVEGQDVVERDGQEGEVDEHGGRPCRLLGLVSVLGAAEAGVVVFWLWECCQ